MKRKINTFLAFSLIVAEAFVIFNFFAIEIGVNEARANIVTHFGL